MNDVFMRALVNRASQEPLLGCQAQVCGCTGRCMRTASQQAAYEKYQETMQASLQQNREGWDL